MEKTRMRTGMTWFLTTLASYACALIVIVSFVPQTLRASSGVRTIWDGVYTVEQAAHGKELYELVCARCHNIEFLGSPTGPSLRGLAQRWRHESMAKLYEKARYTMPTVNRSMLKDQEYLDILSYVLQVNGAPPGKEPLTPDLARLDAILLVPTKDTDLSAVPNFALARVTGCLTAGPNDTWVLTRASDPVLASRSEPPPSGADEGAPLGRDTYQLVSAKAHGAASKSGRKVVARGVLYREAEHNRLTVTSLNVVSDRCTD